MLKKILFYGAASFVSLLAGGFAFLTLHQPERLPPLNIQVPMTPEAIARGEYIFHVVADCAGCHSQRDAGHFAMPVTVAGAGFQFPAEMKLPGTVVGPNLTPDVETGLGAWTDGEKIRAIKEGIGRDGRALFPMMPYLSYREMSDEDLYSVVAYLNTLKPVRSNLPRLKLDFPLNLLIRFSPKPARQAVPPPNRNDKLAWGKYLVTLGSCAGCHSKANHGEPIPGMALAGGEPFRAGNMIAVSANITPDPDTGIGKWTEEHFIDRFHQYKPYLEPGALPAMKPENFTVMPWLNFARMSREELGAIYAYLLTIKPVNHLVETHPGK